MPTKFPSLTEMGVQNPEQIIGYTSVHVSKDLDVLKINYKRPKNSLLPKRRRYEFKRSGKPMPGGELKGSDAIRYDISPILARATKELDAILKDAKRTVATKESLLQELAELKADMNARFAHLSESISNLE